MSAQLAVAYAVLFIFAARQWMYFRQERQRGNRSREVLAMGPFTSATAVFLIAFFIYLAVTVDTFTSLFLLFGVSGFCLFLNIYLLDVPDHIFSRLAFVVIPLAASVMVASVF